MGKKYPAMLFPVVLAIVAGWFSLHALGAQEPSNGYRLKTVVIDAGHGGKDPGSVGKKTTEKEVVLAIALKVGEYIEENMPGVKVIYTRKTDVFVPLHERAALANAHKADLFISIHANGNQNEVVSGTETLVLGLHRAGENFEVAKKENSVILLEDDYSVQYEGFDPQSPESYIIFSLMQNLYFEQSINLAALVQEQFRERAQRKDRGVKQQGLLVLARTAMPGILVEAGFITNADEEAFLVSENGQDYIASAIYRAFRDYKQIVESRGVLHADQSIAAGNNDSRGQDTLVTLTPKVSSPQDLPQVTFRVQVAASSRRVALQPSNFKGLDGVKEYRTGNFYKYAVGNSSTFQDIIPFSRQVKEKFPDAFIIATLEGKIIPLDQALKASQQSPKKTNP